MRQTLTPKMWTRLIQERRQAAVEATDALAAFAHRVTEAARRAAAGREFSIPTPDPAHAAAVERAACLDRVIQAAKTTVEQGVTLAEVLRATRVPGVPSSEVVQGVQVFIEDLFNEEAQ